VPPFNQSIWLYAFPLFQWLAKYFSSEAIFISNGILKKKKQNTQFLRQIKAEHLCLKHE